MATKKRKSMTRVKVRKVFPFRGEYHGVNKEMDLPSKFAKVMAAIGKVDILGKIKDKTPKTPEQPPAATPAGQQQPGRRGRGRGRGRSGREYRDRPVQPDADNPMDRFGFSVTPDQDETEAADDADDGGDD